MSYTSNSGLVFSIDPMAHPLKFFKAAYRILADAPPEKYDTELAAIFRKVKSVRATCPTMKRVRCSAYMCAFGFIATDPEFVKGVTVHNSFPGREGIFQLDDDHEEDITYAFDTALEYWPNVHPYAEKGSWNMLFAAADTGYFDYELYDIVACDDPCEYVGNVLFVEHPKFLALYRMRRVMGDDPHKAARRARKDSGVSIKFIKAV